jgi:hypothetical protein
LRWKSIASVGKLQQEVPYVSAARRLYFQLQDQQQYSKGMPYCCSSAQAWLLDKSDGPRSRLLMQQGHLAVASTI